MIALIVNSVRHELDVEPEMPLLWVLRDELNLTGTKYSCGAALCGACTVLVDNEAIRSCVVAVQDVAGSRITTIEGLASEGVINAVQEAWIGEQVPQCGYCQPGFIVAVTRLLMENPAPSDEDIDSVIDNICRCGTYDRVRRAIHRAAAAMPAPEPATPDPVMRETSKPVQDGAAQ